MNAMLEDKAGKWWDIKKNEAISTYRS